MTLVVELHLRVRRTDGKRVTSRQLYSLVTFDDSVNDLIEDVVDWFEPGGYSGFHLCKWFGGGFRQAPEQEKQFRKRLRRNLRRVARWLRRQPALADPGAARAGLLLDLWVVIASCHEGERRLSLGPELLSACKDLGLSITTETKMSWPAGPGAATGGLVP
jgi:hypothetical protein